MTRLITIGELNAPESPVSPGSTLLGLRNKGLAPHKLPEHPARVVPQQHTGTPILFPGTRLPILRQTDHNKEGCEVPLWTSAGLTYVSLWFEFSDLNILVAVAEYGSEEAGDFPPEWETAWKHGLEASRTLVAFPHPVLAS